MLIIDDEPFIRKLLARMMELEGYDVYTADSCASGLKAVVKHQPMVVICDVFLPDGNGVEMVSDLKQHCTGCEVVLLTAHGNIDDGVQAIKNGAFDYIVKGDDNNKIIPIISRAFEKVRTRVRERGKMHLHTFEMILGTSPALQRAIELARKVAQTDVPVLLTGETGTGKELFAQAIHMASKREAQPFMAVNCSAFSKELLESELFGYCAGAFTGATTEKKGLFEAADKGTLFLDEIGEMNFELQAKLLRVLETGTFLKVGGVTPISVDVRIISATNRNLREEAGAGSFRSDLYYRLSTFQIALPPLRDRIGDIPLLAQSFMKSISEKLGKKVEGMTPEFVSALEKAEWKGNIRELRNVMERSLIVCDKELTFQDLPLDIQQEVSQMGHAPQEGSGMELSSVERLHIARVLQHTHGNKAEAARLLKIGLTTLYRKIEEYKIL